MIAPQKIHKALVVGLRHLKEREQLPITSAGLFQSATDHTLYLSPGDESFVKRRRYGIPEIADDRQFFFLPAIIGVMRKRDVICVNDRSRGGIDRGLDDVLEFSNIPRITVGDKFDESALGHRLAAAQQMIHKKRHVIQTLPQG